MAAPAGCTADSLLDVAIADILSRYPDIDDLLSGTGLALFADMQGLTDIGVLLPVREALAIRGISPDLYELLLERAIARHRRKD